MAGNNPVNRPTASSSTPYGQIPGVPGRPPISLAITRFQLSVDLRRTDEAGIPDLPTLSEIASDEFDTDSESDDLFDWGGTDGKGLKQTEFSSTQFTQSMWQRNFIAFNK